MALLAAACTAVTPVELTGGVAEIPPPLPGLLEPADPPPPPLDGLQDALDAVAAAMLAGDADTVAALVSGPLAGRWPDRARHLGAVPLRHYALVLDDELGVLRTAAAAGRAPGAVVVHVTEEHALEGFDADGPASEDLFLTVVRTEAGWRLLADSDAEELGLVSVDHLWDHGPVVATRSRRLLALHHPGTAVDTILAEAEAALDDLAARWPEPVQPAPLVVPRDQQELGELLHVTFDLSNFVAFATATPMGEYGEYRLTGARVLINPDRFLPMGHVTRRRILAHEFAHVATRPLAGPAIPFWLEEGLAQRLGEDASTTGTGLLDALVRRGTAVDLPEDSQFTTGGRDRIFLSYQLAFSFVDHLVDRYGADAVVDFYTAAGRGSVGQPGRRSYHLDRAAREVFGRPFEELVTEWREALRSGGSG